MADKDVVEKRKEYLEKLKIAGERVKKVDPSKERYEDRGDREKSAYLYSLYEQLILRLGYLFNVNYEKNYDFDTRIYTKFLTCNKYYMLQESLLKCIRMFLLIYNNLYIKNNIKYKDIYRKISKLFVDVNEEIVSQSEDSYQKIHMMIYHVYEGFKKREKENIENQFEYNEYFKRVDDIFSFTISEKFINGRKNRFEKNSEYKKFKKNFLQIFDWYRSQFICEESIFDDITESEEALIEILIDDIRRNEDGNNLLNAMEKDHFEKINIDTREAIVERIDDLVKEGVINKYIRVADDIELDFKVKAIKLKLLRPRAYRVLNNLYEIKMIIDDNPDFDNIFKKKDLDKVEKLTENALQVLSTAADELNQNSDYIDGLFKSKLNDLD